MNEVAGTTVAGHVKMQLGVWDPNSVGIGTRRIQNFQFGSRVSSGSGYRYRK
jgi:hypothetical protein